MSDNDYNTTIIEIINWCNYLLIESYTEQLLLLY